VKIQMLAASVLLATSTHAQESSSETQSIRCGALSHVLTIISTPPELNNALTQSAMFYSSVYAAFREARTGAAATNGEVSGRRDTVEVELRRTWRSRPEAVVQELALCNSWRAEYAPRLAVLNEKTSMGKQLTEAVGTPPVKPRYGEADKWRQIADVGFNAWLAAGAKTGGESKEEIIRQLKQ
jgi:hypothetical protein